MKACPSLLNFEHTSVTLRSQLTINYVHGNCIKLWFTLQIIFSFVVGNVMHMSFKMSFAN